MSPWPITKAPEPRYCSFCGRSEHEATVLLAGPNATVFICDTCVEQAAEVIAAKQRVRGFADPSPSARGRDGHG